MLIGLALALGCAAATNLGFLLRHRGAVAAPPVRARHPLRSAADLFRVRAFALGWAVAVVAWLLHVGALSLAPLSVVQAVISGGLVFLAVLAERFFGLKVGRRQWIGVMITAVGLAVIGLTGENPTDEQVQEKGSLAALIAVESGFFAVSLLLVVITMREGRFRTEGLLLGAAAGGMFGVSDIAIKFLLPAVLDDAFFGLLSPWTLAALAASVIGFYASARGLQLGAGVEVIAIMSVAANLGAIIGGILVFGETIGEGPVGIIGRVLAFLLVVFGAYLIPAPARATGDPQLR